MHGNWGWGKVIQQLEKTATITQTPSFDMVLSLRSLEAINEELEGIWE